MLNHSHSRSDSRSPFLHGFPHAVDTPSPEPRERATAPSRMDAPSSSGRPTTPRRQLQGPRPPRLNVRMESHAIKKPSGAAPAQMQGRREQQPGPPPRAPVIIYDASPKVIHVKPSEFMALVQRLTGPGSGGPPADAQQEHQPDDAVLGQLTFLPPELLLSPSAAMSPAARLATIERSVRPMPAPVPDYLDVQDGGVDDGTLAAILGPARPGILSPLPSSLPPAAASGLFSPLPFDPSCISWLNELSPILRAASTANVGAGASSSGIGGGGGPSNGSSRPPPSYYADPFVPSPRNLLATPTVPSPATCAEFFGSLPDL
ncbi:protein MKS1-like [Phragmites australis]|uniref:protein MKS1-like n=1 Tax=Phragmites australis TaxID=29695 RepID=UPI002D76B15C|nr:protein MKS1-like [Phragmites australis]